MQRTPGFPVCRYMAVFKKLTRTWHDLKKGRPGRRFQDHHDQVAHERGQSWIGRTVKITLGIVAIAVALIEIVFPGPAIVFFFVGGALLASEFRSVAKLMDWSEVRGRKLAGFARRKWRSSSRAAHIGVLTAAACMAVAGMYVTYQIFRG